MIIWDFNLETNELINPHYENSGENENWRTLLLSEIS